MRDLPEIDERSRIRPGHSSFGWSALLALILVTGCEYLAPPHLQWTEAQVVGTIVDGDTHAPVSGAKITRVRPDAPNTGGFGDHDKGGPQMVDQPAIASSNESGRFELEAVKTAYLLLDSFPDYAVTIRIQAQGYQTLQRFYTNVTYVNGDKKTVPIIEAGEIPLRRK